MELGAQKEIREYAEAIYELIKPLVPVTMKAFMDFRMNSIQLSGPEIEAIANGTPIDSVGERREFQEKLILLGLKISDNSK
jgi:thymidylate synthase (FAD)